MKHIVIGLLSLLLVSCGTTMYQLRTDCDMDTKEVFRHITTILMEENLNISHSDMDLGYLKAESTSEFNNYLKAEISKMWVFQKRDGFVLAHAKKTTIYKNEYGAITRTDEEYCNDYCNSDWSWYWNIRNELERLCGGRIRIIEKELSI